MPSGGRLPYLALGGVIAALSSNAEARDIPWLPESATSADQAAVGGDEGTGDGDKSASDQDEPAGQPLGNGKVQVSAPISAVPADTISAQNQCDSPEQLQNRDCRDLAAQERMAWAALGHLALTAIGVVLIRRTLIHTRRAADAAQAAVNEAKAATGAAKETVAVTQQTAERQLRTHVVVDNVLFTERGVEGASTAVIKLRNGGQTPAYKVRSSIQIEFDQDRRASFDVDPRKVAT
jgi:hypothetical protein